MLQDPAVTLEQHSLIGLEKYEPSKQMLETDATQFEESGYVHATAEQRGNCTVGAGHV